MAQQDNIELVHRTIKLYLDISQRVLTPREHEIMRMLLLDKKSVKYTAAHFDLTPERISQIYAITYKKVLQLSRLLLEIDEQKAMLKHLNNVTGRTAGQPDIELYHEKGYSKSNKIITDCPFPFSRAMYNFFHLLEIVTIGQLAEIELKEFSKFRGFGKRLKKELVAFIISENVEELFPGFDHWKVI